MLSIVEKLKKFRSLNDDFLLDTHFLSSYKFKDNKGFPPSYISFSTEVGWGRLCELFLVYIPLTISHPDSWQERSAYIKELMDSFYEDVVEDLDYDFLLEPDGNPNLIKHAIPFAMSENGEYLVWDTLNRNEYDEFPIYVLTSRMSGVRYGGNDIFQFIESCIDNDKVKNVLGSGYNKLLLKFESLELES